MAAEPDTIEILRCAGVGVSSNNEGISVQRSMHQTRTVRHEYVFERVASAARFVIVRGTLYGALHVLFITPTASTDT